MWNSLNLLRVYRFTSVAKRLSIGLSNSVEYVLMVFFILVYSLFPFFLALYLRCASLQCLRSSSTCLVFWLHACIGAL